MMIVYALYEKITLSVSKRVHAQSSLHNSGNDRKLLFIDANVGALLALILIFG